MHFGIKWCLSALFGFVLLEISSSDSIVPSTITAFQSNNLKSRSNDDTLIFAHVIYRHGARNIAGSYPNDPHKNESNWPEGFGQLINEGKRQLFRLGQFFRRRYNDIIGEKYSPDVVYVQSTDVDRAIASALSNLAGLFMPTDEERWNDEIMWQPIPVHTIPKNIDHTLIAAKDCPKYKATLKDYLKESKEVQRIYTEHADLFPYLTRMSGMNIKTITDVYWLYNTLEVEREQNKSLPEWAEKAIEPNSVMEYIAKFDYKTYADTPQLARLKSGFLLKEMLEHFSQKINSTLRPNRSLWLYSAHDVTILNMLNSLGLFELHMSPYAASLHFELYQSGGNEHYIQVFYRKSGEEYPLAMNIPGCGEKCPINKFYDVYSNIIPGDFDSECRLS